MQPQNTITTPQKQCSKCKEFKPATVEFFHRHKGRSDGLYSRCKVCCHAEDKAFREANPEAVRSWKKAEYQRDKEKIIARVRRWEEENAERKSTRLKEKYWADPEAARARIRKASRKFREQNAESERARLREYAKQNREKIRERSRQYREANRDAINERKRIKGSIHQQAREARKKNLPNDFTLEDWQKALDYFGGRCAACGRPPGLFHTLAMDHFVPLSSPDCPGHIATNIIPLCHGDGGCNNSKHDRDALEWAIEKFGKRKGREFVNKIAAYFAAL